MADTYKFVQCQPTTLAGAGSSIGDTSIILSSFLDIEGVALAMTDFGTIGFATIEPGNGLQEEQISFTGITQNAGGTATITGVKTVLFKYPYTQTSGLAKSHAGGVTFVISNTAGFYDKIVAKDNDETITGLYTFSQFPITPSSAPTTDYQVPNKKYVDDAVVAGAPNASTSTKGIVQEATLAQTEAKTAAGSTGARLFVNPSELRATNINDYVASDTGSADAYAIATNPAITAYAEGQVFIFKAANANTGASTLAVSGKAATAIKKNHDIALVAGDIEAGQVVVCVYDGSVMQMISPNGHDPASLYQLLSNLDTTTTLGTSNTLYPSQLAVKTYVDNQTIIWKTGNTTHDMSSDTTTTIAHGLGRTPKYVRFIVNRNQTSAAFGNNGITQSIGTYNASTQNCLYTAFCTNGNTSLQGIDTSHAIHYGFGGGGSADADNLAGAISFDGTNITITWTKTGSPSGTGNIVWEAFA